MYCRKIREYPITPKKGEQMRERNLSINIRVTENEKSNICRKAKRAGLSLSEYIRKCALGQSVISAPNKYLKQAYQSICQMNDSRLDKIKELLLNACYGDDG